MSNGFEFGSDICTMSNDLQFSLSLKYAWMTQINISTMYSVLILNGKSCEICVIHTYFQAKINLFAKNSSNSSTT
jgi:hypothetical protein